MSRERSGDRHKAAYSATGRRQAPLAWLPWAALALLLLLAGIAFLIARNAGDDSDDTGGAEASSGLDTDSGKGSVEAGAGHTCHGVSSGCATTDSASGSEDTFAAAPALGAAAGHPALR